MGFHNLVNENAAKGSFYSIFQPFGAAETPMGEPFVPTTELPNPLDFSGRFNTSAPHLVALDDSNGSNDRFDYACASYYRHLWRWHNNAADRPDRAGSTVVSTSTILFASGRDERVLLEGEHTVARREMLLADTGNICYSGVGASSCTSSSYTRVGLQLLPRDGRLVQPVVLLLVHVGHDVLRVLHLPAEQHVHGSAPAGQWQWHSLLHLVQRLQLGRFQLVLVVWHQLRERRLHVLRQHGRELQVRRGPRARR